MVRLMEPGLANCNDLTVLCRSRLSEDRLLDATCFALQLQAFMSKITRGFDGGANIIDLDFLCFRDIWSCIPVRTVVIGVKGKVWWTFRLHVRMRGHHHRHVNPWCRFIEYWCRESATGGTWCCGMWVYTVYNYVGVFVKRNQLNHFGHLIRKKWLSLLNSETTHLHIYGNLM